ncbi:MAG: mechanosensitive ion channel [Bacteroidales bacterium]|nr:mechanosensitive ion channel [Bacteroidales bacterium]
MNQYAGNETFRIIVAIISFIVLLVIIFFIYRYFFLFFKKKVSRTPGRLDDFVLDLFKIPALWLFYWILLKIFTHIFLSNLPFFPWLLHIDSVLLIFSIAWISIQFVGAGAYYLQGKLDIGTADNLNARSRLTQIKVFKGIVNSLIIIIALSIGLLTFEQVRTIGISLLTSAGIIGIIVGFAAQKSIGMILAGIQLAITQPIRLDDVVIVEGEWGRIEEITLTYVVVKIWDERRLVLPVTWFLEKPFQNWTRTGSEITGTIFLYVDFSFPVDSIRVALPEMLKGNPDWDGRLWNVQVTKITEQFKEVRVLLSSVDASKNWDLRAAIREKLIDFINTNYPDTFAKIRIKTN